ncbi:MAG: calcium-binding protein [Desulfovibrio sp.]|nr:calcium-binding protein [Desulfovibrio sp.]
MKSVLKSGSRSLRAAALGACLIFPVMGCAAESQAPEPAPVDRFDVMDINHDGKVVMEEFSAAFPNMNEQAFVLIDKNGDKGIERAEWIEFMENHGKSSSRPMGAPMNNIPGDPMIPPVDSSDLPLVRPPQ